MALTDWAAGGRPSATGRPDDQFLAKARRVARKAETLRKMRQEAQRTGFQALPLPDYLAELARAARVSLASLLPAVPKANSPASPWIQAAHEIGMEAVSIRLLARLWIAVRQAKWEPSPVMARRTGRPVANGLTEIPFNRSSDAHMLERRLEAIEKAYPPDTRELLKATMAEIDL